MPIILIPRVIGDWEKWQVVSCLLMFANRQNVPHSCEAIPFDVCIAKGARWRGEDDGNWRLP